MKKKAKKAIEAVNAKQRHWTYETQGTYNPTGISNFLGKVKDETGRVVLSIREDEDFNHLSRILNTSKHMAKWNDTKGLAMYIWERNLIPMEDEEKAECKKKKRPNLDIQLVSVV